MSSSTRSSTSFRSFRTRCSLRRSRLRCRASRRASRRAARVLKPRRQGPGLLSTHTNRHKHQARHADRPQPQAIQTNQPNQRLNAKERKGKERKENEQEQEQKGNPGRAHLGKSPPPPVATLPENCTGPAGSTALVDKPLGEMRPACFTPGDGLSRPRGVVLSLLAHTPEGGAPNAWHQS